MVHVKDGMTLCGSPIRRLEVRLRGLRNGVSVPTEPNLPAINEGKGRHQTKHHVRELGYNAAQICGSAPGTPEP